MRKLFLLTCSLMAVALASLPASGDSLGDPADRICVMISVDGLASFYFDDPKAEMPAIRELAAKGARSAMMKASTPTVTWPNHTTLVTGVTPAKHGVVGNNFFDRATGRKVALISDPVFDKDQIVKVPTLYDLAHTKGLKTAAIRWPATRNAKSLDWTVPDMKGSEVAIKYSTPALLTEGEQAGLHLKPDYDSAETTDVVCTHLFNEVLHAHRPNLALLHVIAVDHVQHSKGPRSPEAYAAIKVADQQVREVWDELQKDFPGKATLFVVSDHGFSPITHTLLPNVALRQAGLVASNGAAADDAVHVVPQGGSAMIYVRDTAHRAEVLSRTAQAVAGLPGLAKVVGPEQLKDYGVADPQVDPHAPDMMLFADEGWAIGDTSAGDVPFKDKIEVTGTHGHDPNLPHLHATFVAWGAGIKPGVQLGEIANTCVAPTIAHFLDVALPNPDGQVLTAILAE